jgi:hypothetical protein
MKADLIHDEQGVSAIVGYIVTFMIASIIFTIVLIMANSMFIDGPQKTVSRVQFTDIGNDLTAKVVDTYLIVHDSSDVSISTTFEMPSTVASKDYMADVRKSSTNPDDREVVVYSPYNEVSIYTTLNGINSTIPVSGSTSSLMASHKIFYSKT